MRRSSAAPLDDQPRVRGECENSPATHARIVAESQHLGYVRDPMLRALATYRHGPRRRGFRGVIGWLSHSTPGYDWRTAPEYVQYHAGATRRALELGYQLSIFDLAGYAQNPACLVKVMRARNVRGLLVCPQPSAGTELPLDFSELGVVAIGYTVRTPVLHVAATHFYDSMREIVQRLRARGYRRIGYAIPTVHKERTRGFYLAAFLLEQSTMMLAERFAPYEAAPPDFSGFSALFAAQQPDALNTVHNRIPEFLEQMRIEIPQRLGVALVSVTSAVRRFSGIDEQCEIIGGIATEFVASLLEHGHRGVPTEARRMHVEGKWWEGESLRRTEERVYSSVG